MQVGKQIRWSGVNELWRSCGRQARMGTAQSPMLSVSTSIVLNWAKQALPRKLLSLIRRDIKTSLNVGKYITLTLKLCVKYGVNFIAILKANRRSNWIGGRRGELAETWIDM